MKNKHILIILLAMALLFGSTACHKDAQIEPKTPKVAEPEVSFTATTADFGWAVSFPGKVSSVVKVSRHADMSDATSYGDATPTSNKDFHVEIAGLSPETQYYYCFEIWNPNLNHRSEVKSFTTLTATKPSVTTYTATNISWTTATAGGNVTDDGNDVVLERGVCWGISHNPNTGSDFSHLAASSAGTGEYSCTLTGLAPGTKYYVRAYSTNSQGTSYGDEKDFTTQALQKPTVITASVSQFNFTNATAVGGGEVTSDGGDAVTERGIYFGTSPNPAATGTKLVATSAGTGSFTCTMTGLVSGTYYVCAYATNGQGTSNGSEKSFSYNPPPTGAINGIFSVSPSNKVYFSQGNLQYIGSAATPYWKFADNQWDYFGETTGQNSYSVSVDRDLFGWGTSGYDHGAVCYQPWCTSTVDGDYRVYGNGTYDLYDQTGQADWGYNPISNGGNQSNQWHTLTLPEWNYVFEKRTTTSGIRYATAKVNNVNGVILLPDDWRSSTYSLNNTNSGGYDSNVITASQWSVLEQAGAVFLPAAGSRYGTSVNDVGIGSYGDYWSASGNDSNTAFYVRFHNSGHDTTSAASRCRGLSVRLVQDY